MSTPIVHQCECPNCQQLPPTTDHILHQHKVNAHDFLTQAVGRAAPYGIYDLQRNQGAVYVGQSADTPEFAVAAITRWWLEYG